MRNLWLEKCFKRRWNLWRKNESFAIAKIYIKHGDSKKVIEDCKQDLEVDLEGIKQGLKGGVCEEKALEMEKKYPYY